MPNQDRRYSEQTQELMGRLPRWIIRWGMLVIFLIFIGILIGTILIKYPQIVSAPITITTVNPPSDLIAKSTGRIDSLFAKDGDLLKINAPVALLHNTSHYEDVDLVTQALKSFHIDSTTENSWIAQEYQMGELQNTFSEFRDLYKDYEYYIKVNNIPKKIALIGGQVRKQKHYLSQLRNQRKLHIEDLSYTYKIYQRDSTLYSQKVLSSLEFERSAQAKIQKENALASFESSLTTAEMSVLQMEQQLVELQMQYDNEIATYKRQINERVGQLAAQIKQWQNNYLLLSPIEGKLSFSRYWSNSQNIQVGETLATVVPTDATEVIGIMTVPSAGFGKVAVGQKVNIKLHGYPYMEYGVLKGKITRLSSVPDSSPNSANTSQRAQNVYIAEVTFPDGMQTSYKEHLTLIQQMDGEGDIITQDQRLIQRFIQPLRALFDKISD